VIALGNLAGELKASLEAAVRGADLELLLTREPARAFVELERDGAIAVLVDMATLGAEQFCKRARGTERLRSVPVIGMSRHPNELGFARVFAWGADDLVPLGATAPLERRLIVLRDTKKTDTAGFGRAVVAEATTQRRALVGRVLAQAGYDVKFAVDRGAVELYASQSETRLVVISAALGDPRRMIEAAARAGALPTWIVTAEARSVARLASSLSGLDRVAVTSTSGSPEDVLFLANELVFAKGTRRREFRALYATPVAFRAQGSDADEYGFSYDASPSGLYVRSLLPCETDDVEVELRLPVREERVRLTGKVARRFAFGSGAIASAPPGFSVKLEGPPAELERWADACQKLIQGASDAVTNPPPGEPSDAVGAPSAGTALAVPPATLTIESVVAPLPKAVLEAVEQGSDVGELLAATLDEQTLAEVGTKPVTMDADTLDVREERPSEIMMRTASEIFAELEAGGAGAPGPKVDETADAKASLPLPAPASAPSEAVPTGPRESAPTAAPKPELHDWESDAKTAVRQSRPDHDEATPAREVKATPPEPPSARKEPSPKAPAVTPAASPPAPPSARKASSPKAPAAEPAAFPPAPPSARKAPSPRAPTAEPAPAAAPGGPPPVPSRRNPRSTMIGLAPPGPGSAAPEGLERTQQLPPPNPRARMASAPTLEPVAEAAPPPTQEKEPPSPVAPEEKESPPSLAPEEKELPPSLVPEPEPDETGEAVTLVPPSPDEPVELAPALPEEPAPAATAAADFARAATVEVPVYVPDAAIETQEEPPAPPSPPGRYRAAILLAALAAAGLGAGAAFVFPKGRPPGPASSTALSKPELTTPGAAPPSTPTSEAPAAEALTAAVPPPPPPANAETLPTPESEPEPPPSAPSASPAPPATTSAAPVVSAATPTPTHAPVEFDLRKLPPERAALFVHSSATARVFVHGADYGDTNQVLITTCGIRFVRLGRALGDFIEPGQSYVIKCGRLTELSIEPAR
jgi:DNA-binding response OmpR family regulator